MLNSEELMQNAQGARRWLSTTKVPLRDEEGKILGVVVISRDITEQKVAQEKVIEANQNLTEAVAELKKAHEELRSVQLQLIEAEKMKSIGRLAAGVAHEVKNPLAIINMGVAYLSQQQFPDDKEVPQVLREIDDAVKRADAVIKGLLDFSAPKKLDVQEEDLNAIIEQSLLLVRGEMKNGTHHVVKELQRGLPPLKVDRLKIGQVFVNVFTNALHAMPGGGTLTVRTHTRQHTGVGENIGDSRSESFRVGSTLVVVEIDDNGTGIPADKLTKVFDPFFTTKTTGEGTGLGLSVTRSIIDLHGGTIEIHNRPEGGARVTITFEV
jgi:signal transduction histidine kinase